MRCITISKLKRFNNGDIELEQNKKRNALSGGGVSNNTVTATSILKYFCKKK